MVQALKKDIYIPASSLRPHCNCILETNVEPGSGFDRLAVVEDSVFFLLDRRDFFAPLFLSTIEKLAFIFV